MMSSDLENRIRARAHRIWMGEGCLDGKADSHWELAKMAVALEDARPQMLRPIEAPIAEPLDAWANQGEFPTLTDQGEQSAPGERTDRDAD
jgi:hypothetical protein